MTAPADVDDAAAAAAAGAAGAARRRERAALRRPALLWAVVLGVQADALLRADGRPALNLALWALAGAGGLAVLWRQRGEPAARESWWLLGGALACAATLAWRDAAAPAVFSLLVGGALLGLAAGRAGTAWVARALPADVAASAGRVALLCAAGPLGWGRAARGPDAGPDGWTRAAATTARGALMALPALLVLGALLASADPVFGGFVERALRPDVLLAPLLEHVLFAGLVAWLSAGLLRAFLVGDEAALARVRVPQPAVAPAELTVALSLLNLLFLAFMAVQLRYLFGGASLVEVTAGLGYADYARRGFFELVATAALVVPILLVADWAAAPHPSRARAALRLTMLVLVALLLGVLASAAWRMRLYQAAYGLTELRLYVSVFMTWLTLTLGWLVFTVLEGRRERFAVGGIVAGVTCLALLHALDPHALIARVNLARAARGAAVDDAYLASLSADAVPTILARLPRLPAAERCRIGGMLVERWGGERPGGWRTWNLGDWRARRLIDARAGTLACGAARPAAPPRATPLGSE